MDKMKNRIAHYCHKSDPAIDIRTGDVIMLSDAVSQLTDWGLDADDIREILKDVKNDI